MDFELETFYDEFAKPIGERRPPMVRKHDKDAIKVYRRWQALNKSNPSRTHGSQNVPGPDGGRGDPVAP
jgi:hypothetical protein